MGWRLRPPIAIMCHRGLMTRFYKVPQAIGITAAGIADAFGLMFRQSFVIGVF